MSFAAISSAAYSAMMTSQVKTQVAANNIANADTAGYTAKTVTVAASPGGVGVSITGITSAVDKYLLEDIVAATSQFGAAEVAASYADMLQSYYGSTDGSEDTGTSLAQSLASLESALIELADAPASDTLKAEVVAALDTVASQLRTVSSSIQDLRAQADQEIADQISVVNDALAAISDLNDKILAAKAQGLSTADLEDQRQTALQTVAENLDVNSYIASDGSMRVTTASGTTLVGSSKAYTLSYEPAGSVTTETVFGAITVSGKDITGEVSSGAIGALVELRDETLVEAEAELDELAAGLIDAVNDAYGTATALPAPESLTGTTQVSGADTLSATGTFRLALTDSDGNAALVADFDLSSYATIGDFVTALDALAGVSASIDASGHLTIASDDADLGVAIAETDVSVDGGSGLAAHFGFNQLLTGTDARSIAVDAAILDEPGLLATASLSNAAGLAVGDSAIDASSAQVTALTDVFTEGYDFDQAGSLSAATRTFADYAASIVAGVAADAGKAEAAREAGETSLATLTETYAGQTGVNLDEETARLTELEQYYAVAAQILNTLNQMFDSLLQVAESA